MREHKKNTVKTGRKRFTTVAGSAAAVVLSAAIVVTSVWHDSIEAQAADTLLGIEKLRNQVQLSGKDYTILEIVPDKSAAEIGFWVDGYEPILGTWDEEGNWVSWKDQLVSCLTPEERKEFVERKKKELLAYYSSKYASTDKTWEEDFPVYGAEDEYEESDKPQDGFEEISGENISETGYFTHNDDNRGSYQVAFEFVGKNTVQAGIPQDTVYYKVVSTTNIKDDDLWQNLPEDVWVYQKLSNPGSKGEYEYIPHLWGQIKESYQPVSAAEDTDPGDDDGDKDKDKDKDDDDNKGGDNEGGDNEGGDNEGGDNEGGDDEGGDNEGGDNEGGDNEGDDGNKGGDNEGGDGNKGGNNEGGDGNKGDNGDDGKSESGSGDTGSKDLSVRPSSARGRWIKMVSENEADPVKKEDPAKEEDPAKNEDSAKEEDPAKKEDPAEAEDPAENEDPAEDEDPVKDEDPEEGADSDVKGNADSISANSFDTADGLGEWFLVKFARIEGSTKDEMCYAVKDPTAIQKSVHGYDAYDFVEVELPEDADFADGKNRQAQKYTFVGKIIYCRNTFKSNEWFKKYALDMEKKDYGKFSAKVITLTPKELNEMETLPAFDFLYLSSGSQRVFDYDDNKKEEDGSDKTKSKTADDEEDDDSEAADDEEDDDSEAEDDEEDDDSKAADDGEEESSDAGDDAGEKDKEEKGKKDDADAGKKDDTGEADDTNGTDSHTGFKLYVKTGDSETDEGTEGETDEGPEGKIGEGSGEEPGEETEPVQSAVSYGADNDLSEDTLKYLVSRTVAGALPCLVDGRILYEKGTGNKGEGDTEESGQKETGSEVIEVNEDLIKVNEDLKGTNIFRLAAIMCQESPEEWYKKNSGNLTGFALKKLLDGIVEDADKNFVTENVYCRLDDVSIINKDFHTPTIYQDGRDMEPGFQRVLDEILLDNTYRAADSSGNYKPLSTDIGQSTAVRHIINYQNRRKVETKENIKVLEIQPAKVDKPELTLEQLQKWAPGVKTADITVMTTAEFIGKIDKLNETYDLIYIGTSEDHLNVKYWDMNWGERRWFTSNDDGYRTPESEKRKGRVSAGTVFNDSNMDGLIYYNIGDLRAGSVPLAGQLDTEYVNPNDRNGDVFAYNYYRYGGNDITKEKRDALISFLDGSYPVIVADDFMEEPVTIYGDANYKGPRVSLSTSQKYYSREDLDKLGDRLAFDISSIKVKEGYQIVIFDEDYFTGNAIVLKENADDLGSIWRYWKDYDNWGVWSNYVRSAIVEKVDDEPPVRRINEDHIDNCTYLYDFVNTALKKNYTNFYTWSDIEDDSELFKFYLNRPKVSMEQRFVNGEREDDGEIRYIRPGTDGKYKLEFRFAIHNEGAASANSRYQCRLYIDINSDGKFSAEEEVPDINLTQGGGYASTDSLYIDREYTLTRGVPDGYKGLLPWKVEVTQADNKNIYASMKGYTKLAGMEQEKIDVIQISRTPWRETDVLNLEREIADENSIFHALVEGGTIDGVQYKGISEDYEIHVDCMTIAEYEDLYRENPDCMSDYNMLILGFSDLYDNFSGTSEEGPMSAIVDFINSGKSVLFAHDTTSFVNYAEGVSGHANKTNPSSTAGAVNTTSYFAAGLNKYVRGLVGMDRYGILSDNGNILRRGQALQKGSGSYDAVVGSGRDVAYEPKSGRERTVPQVHGYTYHIINLKDGTNDNNKKREFTPAELDPSLTGNFFNTFRNIRYDQVYYVWSRSDYGEGQQSGAVSYMNVDRVNEGQITEYPYHLPEKFEVATTHGQYYELDFTADDDGDEQSDLVVWYCLGNRTVNGEDQETIYSQSPNDVRNNYYIYNKGNVTYTGMGHGATHDDKPYTVDEAKLFINTIIAAYQAGVKQPNITVLKSGLEEAPEMKTMYRYYDDTTSAGSSIALDDRATPEDYEKIYFRVQDLNFVKGTRAIATHVFYEAKGGGETTISVGGNEISVNPLADDMYDAKDDSPVDATNLKSNGIYYIRVPKAVLGQYDDGLNLYFEAQTTITTNTVNQNQYITDKVYAKLKVLKAFLFDLE